MAYVLIEKHLQSASTRTMQRCIPISVIQTNKRQVNSSTLTYHKDTNTYITSTPPSPPHTHANKFKYSTRVLAYPHKYTHNIFLQPHTHLLYTSFLHYLPSYTGTRIWIHTYTLQKLASMSMNTPTIQGISLPLPIFCLDSGDSVQCHWIIYQNYSLVGKLS